jgi:hypothetical protein
MGLSLMLSSPGEVNALTQAEWEAVAGYFDGYIQSQYGPADDGEAGYLITAPALKSLLDSDGNGNYLDVGDNMANRPVLVDNLWGNAYLIPGTSLRTRWDINGFDTTTVDAIKAKVDAHRDAGFDPNIVIY